ncbi:MAG: carboxypeptidase-like regulatory domain-containing protein [Candidatus Sulfotelmatobacter sp.]
MDDIYGVMHSAVVKFGRESMRRAFLAGVCLVLFSRAVRAQSTDGFLSGRVTDSSKARIVAATITLLSSDTNVRYQTRTNAVGEYFLTNVPPGHYRIEVEKPDFKKLVKPDVILHVQDIRKRPAETV